MSAIEKVLNSYRNIGPLLRVTLWREDVKQAAAELAALKQRNRELEAYVAKTKNWFDSFGEHAPIHFGGEAEMSEEARALLKSGKNP